MAKQPKRTFPVASNVVDELRTARGWSIEDLGNRSGLHLRTLTRIMSGKPAYLHTVSLLADVLGVEPQTLIVSAQSSNPMERFSGNEYEVVAKIQGTSYSKQQEAVLRDAAHQFISKVKAAGATVVTSSVSLVAKPYYGDINLVTGHTMKNGRSIWAIIAITDTNDILYREATDESFNLDLYREYGHIVATGEGEIPLDVHHKVWNVFVSDPHALMTTTF